MTQRSITLKSALLLSCGLAALTFTGCGMTGGSNGIGIGGGTGVTPGAKTTGFGGRVHGGQQAVSGATVILWAAGTTTGYGQGSTNIASTTTASDGSFSLDTTANAAISAYSVTSNIATFTTATSNIGIGATVTLSGFATSTFFNGQSVTVLSSSPTQFTANVSAIIPSGDNGTIAQTTEAGSAAYPNSPCSAGQYLYLTATGGNAGAGTNNAIGLMAAIPQVCSSATANTYVFMDEVTTVAAVTALQQFMSINTGATAPYAGTGTVPWTIGAPSTNTTGLANAFLETANLANITTGTSYNSTATNTVGGVLYTTTIVPDFNKIDGLADILATCINDSTGNLCSGSAGVLTLTTIATGTTTPTYTVPIDTIQAAYNMATLPNAALYSGSKYWKSSTGSTTYLSMLWSNITAQSPFQPYSASVPPDTAILEQWRTVNASNATVGTVYAASIAIDGFGNLWTAGGSGVTSNFVNQFNHAGQLLLDTSTVSIPSYTLTYYADTATSVTASTTPNSTYPLGIGGANSLAIDTNNNAWFASTGAVSPGTLTTQSLISGVLAQISQSGTATGYLTGSSPSALAIDNSNNLFMNDIPTSGRYYMSELPASGAYETVYEGIGRNSHVYDGVTVDSHGYAWAFYSVCSANFAVPRISSAAMVSSSGTGSGSTAGNVTLPSNCTYTGAGDANGNMWATDNVNLYYINIGSSLTAPTVTTAFTGGATTGLDIPQGMALDGAGNLWVANKGVVNTIAGVAEFATGGTAGAVTLLSPAGTGVAGFGSGSVISVDPATPTNVALDSSGDVWFQTPGGSFLYHLVGIAAPTKTPLASSLAAIGTKP